MRTIEEISARQDDLIDDLMRRDYQCPIKEERLAYLELLRNSLREPSVVDGRQRGSVSFVMAVQRIRRRKYGLDVQAIDCSDRLFKFINETKEGPCLDCWRVGVRIEFDHVKGVKKFNIAEGLLNFKRKGFKLNDLIVELLKVEPVCPTCHRVREHIRGLHRISKLKELHFLESVFINTGIRRTIETMWARRRKELARAGQISSKPTKPQIEQKDIKAEQTRILKRTIAQRDSEIAYLKAELKQARKKIRHYQKRNRR